MMRALLMMGIGMIVMSPIVIGMVMCASLMMKLLAS